MFLAALIFILSTALFFFYLQAACQNILRTQFDREYFQAIVNANRLEFPSIHKAVQEFDAPVPYARLRMMIKCDYLALTYLLKNAANAKQRYSREERMLILYFRLVFLSQFFLHLLRLREKPVILKLTEILRYFANVVGQRVDTARFGEMTASDVLLNL